MSKEEQDFFEFMAKLEHKALETQKDFNNLSDNNKTKVIAAINKIIEVNGISGLLNYLSTGIGDYKNN